jgi:hypothetical protein
VDCDDNDCAANPACASVAEICNNGLDDDGDGLIDCDDPDCRQIDSDGDGTPDCNDGCANDPHKTAPGICGCGMADIDSDGDGTPDCNDQFPNDPNRVAPGTGGLCFIDLLHNSAALGFQFVPAKDRPDAFGPFMRVTNSYNGLRALAFDIGFLRKVCTYGLTLPKSIIRFKFTHLQRDLGKEINFEVAHEHLSKLRASFSEYLCVLRDFKVTRPEFEPLFWGFF